MFGIFLSQNGELERGESAFRKGIDLNSESAAIYNNLGNNLKDQRKLNEAIFYYKKALEINPIYSEALNNLGTALVKSGLGREAIKFFEKAIESKVNFTEAYGNFGIALIKTGDFDKAEKLLKKALRYGKKSASVYMSLGMALREMGKVDEALFYYERGLEGTFDTELQKLIYNSMSQVYLDKGCISEVLELCSKALIIDPSYAEPHYNKALIDLKMGKWKEGWKGFEYRWKLRMVKFSDKKSSASPLVPVSPYWDFRSPGRLLCWAEQGVGDQLMFASCINELRLHCDELVVSCDERLISLFKRSFDKSICFVKQDPHISGDLYDFHIPIGSAYGFLRQSDKSFEDNRKAYLLANSHKREELRKRLASINPGKKIAGISWSSSALKDASKRSIQLADLVNNIPDSFSLVNLQYGDVSHEIMEVEKSTGRSIIQVNDIDNFNDLDDFSAIIQACDIVVSIDNSTVHFAGALGVECHLLLPFSHASDWRWGLNGTPESYSYDKMFLHWQDSSHNWNTCLHGLKKKLGMGII